MEITLDDGTRLPALLDRPDDARALLVLAHGAGAGMRHAFMEAVAERLASRGVATLRYEFPYMARGGGRPDRPAVATAAVRGAVAAAGELVAGTGPLAGVPLFAGGKSFGGRMTSTAASQGPLLPTDAGGDGVRGLVFLGFPLHPPGRPGTDRAGHLSALDLPMLFVQGTRDRLAGLDLLGPVLEGLRPRATLHVEEGADHGFHVLKRSGRTDQEVLDGIADAVAAWMEHEGSPGR